MKNYDYFINSIKENITKLLKERYNLDVDIQEDIIYKINITLNCYRICIKGTTIAPVIYIEQYYDQYLKGVELQKIVDELVEIIYDAYINYPLIPELSIEVAKKSIKLVLINKGKNEELLKTIPYVLVGEKSDIVAIPKWFISDRASFIVNKEIVKILKITEEEVLDMGYKNIREEDYIIKPISKILEEMLEELPEELQINNLMWVITTKNLIEGANAILNDNILKKIYNIIGRKYYILPSSIHEIIVVPDFFTYNTLKEMVEDVNKKDISIQEFLSNNILYYDGENLIG